MEKGRTFLYFRCDAEAMACINKLGNCVRVGAQKLSVVITRQAREVEAAAAPVGAGASGGGPVAN